MQAFENAIQRSMTMSEEVWERHANPWSVWTRIATFPFLIGAGWSFHWIGWWGVIPLGLVALWTWLNPRLFAKPAHTDNWSSRAVFGERLWLKRRERPIPAHHERVALVLTVISAGFAIVLVVGLVLDNAVMILAGGGLSVMAKIWFCDRMAWLFGDMARENPDLQDWIR